MTWWGGIWGCLSIRNLRFEHGDDVDVVCSTPHISIFDIHLGASAWDFDRCTLIVKKSWAGTR